jgi:two-component system, cell cycle sensor histidine kinase and response regulator CckA
MKIVKKEMKKKTTKPKTTDVAKVGDVQRLVQLLRINQIELEHQNQELRIAQEELEVSRNKYVSLFDFAPIPYFTLNKEGIINEVNLIASKMLGVDRNKLVGKRFITFIRFEDKEAFNLFMDAIFNYHIKSSSELKVIDKDKRVFDARLEGLEMADNLLTEKKCQVALIEL